LAEDRILGVRVLKKMKGINWEAVPKILVEDLKK
jgi:hypothetical protein